MEICIVGAGITGLTTGYNLSKKGHKITVIEKDKDIGGLVKVHKTGSTLIEDFYHHIFTTDAEILNLIDELGLTNDLMWLSPKNAIFINNLYPFTSPIDLLLFKELSVIGRIRTGLMYLQAKSLGDWKALETLGAREWIEQKAGKEVYQKVWEPLIRSKFDIDADKIPAVWLWNKFKLRGSSRGKNISKELLGYLKGSFGKVITALSEKILKSEGKIMTGTEVKSITPLPDGKLALKTEQETFLFDKIILTCAPHEISNIEIPFSQDYKRSLSKIKYKANICTIIELSKNLSPYYWISVADNKFPFVLVIEHTNLVKDPDYKNNIVYISRYLDETNELYSYSNNEIENLFLNKLKDMFPGFDKNSVLDIRTNRSKYAQPVVVKEYSKIILEHKTPIKNLYIANMSQIYPEDRGQNYSVRLGNKISEIVLSE